MKRKSLEFFRRGMIACGIGPIVFVIVCLIVQRQAGVQSLTVEQVSMGILSLSALAFIAGGMNMIYGIERLPLAVAILIHGCVLYVSYLGTYLLNGWLAWGIAPILIFSGIFAVGYLVIWTVIYFAALRNTARLNEKLNQKRQNETES